MSWKAESKNSKENENEYDFDERIRDLKRRIKEARERLFSPQPTIVERIQKVDEQRRSLESSSEAKRNAELDELRNKLRRKS